MKMLEIIQKVRHREWKEKIKTIYSKNKTKTKNSNSKAIIVFFITNSKERRKEKGKRDEKGGEWRNDVVCFGGNQRRAPQWRSLQSFCGDGHGFNFSDMGLQSHRDAWGGPPWAVDLDGNVHL